MRIAYYSHYFTPEIGAPSARIHEMSKEWVAAGHDVSVVTCFPNHPIGRIYDGYRGGLYMREKLNGIDIHRHWTYVTPNRGFLRKTLGHLSFYPSALVLSNRRVPKPEVAIGSSPTFFAAMAAASMARRCKVPFVMEVRDLWPAIFVDLGVIRNRRVIRLLEAWELGLYRGARHIITVTESFRKNLIDRGIPPEKVSTIYNGADTTFWRRVDVPPGVSRGLDLEGKKVILYLGAHGISHALSAVLDAAARLRERNDIRFLFVGEGAEKERLKAEAAAAGLSNVLFLEPVDKEAARRFYSLATACLVPLRDIPLFDTFIPSKMFEIMAMGRPIIGSVRGEACDILRRSGGAVIVAPEDGAAIATAAARLCSEPAEVQALGEAGRRFVGEHFSRSTLARRYLDILSALPVNR
jgi:glycosyltransferase involved in cell wall biosynthesis